MWFELSVLSMLAYGVQDFLFKLAEARNLDYRSLLTVYSLTVLLVSLLHYLVFPKPIEFILPLALFALIQVMFFLSGNVLKLESLRTLPSVVVYPVFALNGVGTALLAALFLGAPMGAFQLLGVAVSAVALLLLIERKGHTLLPTGLWLAFAGLVLYSLSNFVTAAALPYMVPAAFIAFSSLFAAGPYYILESRLHKRHGKLGQSTGMGIAIGLVNSLAFFALLYAITDGPVSVVFPLVGMSLLVSVVMSRAAFGEPLPARKAAAIALAVVAILLIKLNV
jgi:drug/metabolite transporter (DMT)-like permease